MNYIAEFITLPSLMDQSQRGQVFSSIVVAEEQVQHTHTHTIDTGNVYLTKPD